MCCFSDWSFSKRGNNEFLKICRYLKKPPFYLEPKHIVFLLGAWHLQNFKWQNLSWRTMRQHYLIWSECWGPGPTACLGPGCEGVDGHKVGPVLTVGVGQHPPQLLDNVRRSPGIRTYKTLHEWLMQGTVWIRIRSDPHQRTGSDQDLKTWIWDSDLVLKIIKESNSD